ncbi:MAG TPA: Uma2 family endonuclease [Pirellulales bacterium]|nr:Uma2 family endonuclease [Pirellulales bacterium]
MQVTSLPGSPTGDSDFFYPTGDGRPVGETPAHRDNLLTLCEILGRFYANDPLVYVSGNMFLYYERGNRLKHLSPDVFVVKGIPKTKLRKAYFTWEEEGKAPDFVIELTSASTREEDIDDKKRIYRDILGIREYFLFDPYAEYLDPRLQGFRLDEGKYVSIAPLEGRLPSQVTGLHLEGHGEELRLYNPTTGAWLPTAQELLTQVEFQRQRADAERVRAESERVRAESERDRAESDRDRAEAELDAATAENRRLQEELAELRRRLGQTEA